MNLRSKKVFVVSLAMLAIFFQAHAAPSRQFLALADWHFNPFSYCTSTQIPCSMITKLRAANPTGPATDKNSWQTIFNQAPVQSISPLGSDTNEALLDSTLNYIATLPTNYDFVTVNGDFIAHHFSDQFAQYSGIDVNSPHYQAEYQAFVRKTFEYLQYRLHQTFPSKSIYITLGNNDSYDGDYAYSPDQRDASNFYHQMTQIWSPSIINSANQGSFELTFGKAGYYAITVPENNPNSPNRILFLNTTLYSANNTQSHGTRVPAAAEQQFDWLKAQLKQVRQQGGHAILVYHIPNGADNYASASAKAPVMLWGIKNGHRYNDEFSQIIHDYQDVISATMTAHFHMDGFQFLRKNQHDKGVLDTFANGISPNNYSNPAFKLYEYDPTDLTLRNFQVWYENEGSNNIWDKEYDFNLVYQPTCELLGNCNLTTGYQKVHAESTDEKTRLYIALYSARSGQQPINKGAWLPYYWCATQYQLDLDYAVCLHQ